MTDGRRRLVGALTTLCISALGTSVLSATPSSAEPTISDVRDRVAMLYHQAERASERANQARIRLAAARNRLDSVEVDLRAQRRAYATVRDRVAAAVQGEIESHTLGSTAELVLADDPDTFLANLASVDQYTKDQDALAQELADQAALLDVRRQRAGHVVARLAEDRAALVESKAAIKEKAAQATALLQRLEQERAAARALAAEREARVSRAGRRPASGATAPAPAPAAPPPAATPASGSAAAAVQFALAQVGDAYVYGAAGPSAYDCSGLTMSAWGQAGVTLPHSSSAQYSSGAPVSTSALQPGDLVFYYSPISHVAIYIGNGMIVHAANPSQGVRVDPVGLMPIAGAVRPG